MADSNRLHSINTSRILRAIWLNPGVSRIQAAELLDLDRSTVTKIMQVILDRGLVVTAGKSTEQSGVGRRQVQLRIREDLGVVIGLELQAARCSGVITTLEGSVLHSFESPGAADAGNLAERIVSVIALARKWIDGEGLFLLGIGIGLPGVIDPYTGTVIRSHSFGLGAPRRLKDELEPLIPEPIFFENDANCCCWAELAFACDNRSRNFISVLGEFRTDRPNETQCHGFALGTGIVIRERVLHGDHFTAGEFRTVYSNPETGQFEIPWRELASLPENISLLDTLYRELAENLAFLVNCFDLTKIVFAGDLPEHRGNLASYVESAVADNWNYDISRELEIEFSRYGKAAVSIGAAGLFVEKLFSVPDIADRFQEMVGYDLYEYILKRKG
ncbi:MAG TPA: ROK family transcriptional regulator [Treponemataceae bacterium]|nr:ROK family transcriptional regulator [Treponemataceae bacterium]